MHKQDSTVSELVEMIRRKVPLWIIFAWLVILVLVLGSIVISTPSHLNWKMSKGDIIQSVILFFTFRSYQCLGSDKQKIGKINRNTK